MQKPYGGAAVHEYGATNGGGAGRAGAAAGDLEPDARATAMRAVASFCDKITREKDKLRNAESAERKRKRMSNGRSMVGKLVRRRTSTGTHVATIVKYTAGTTYHLDRYTLRFPPGTRATDAEKQIGPQAVRASLIS